MNLDALTPDQKAGLLFALLSAGIGLVVAIKIYIEARGKAIEKLAERDRLEAAREHDETTTKNNTIKVITDRFAKSDDLNSSLHRQLMECEVNSKEKDGIIKELRSMNHVLIERIEIKDKLLMQSAGQIKALTDLNNLQEARLRELEFKEAQRLKDGYGQDKPNG